MMLVLRQEQVDIFDQYRRKEFERRALAELSKKWSPKFKEMGEQGASEFVHEGTDLALSHDISSDGDVVSFLELLLIWGKDLGESRGTIWASRILRNPKASGQQKVKRLLWKSNQLIDGAAGEAR